MVHGQRRQRLVKQVGGAGTVNERVNVTIVDVSTDVGIN